MEEAVVSRARKEDESFEEYRDNLRKEAKVLKYKLKGKWSWKTFFPVDADTREIPKGAQIYEKDKHTGKMVLAMKFNPYGAQHYVKMPPYRNPKRKEKLRLRELWRRV